MSASTRQLKRVLVGLCLLVPLAFAPAALAQGQGGEQVNIELILDASGSMFNKLEDERYRITAAKDVLTQLISGLPAQPGLNVGLRVYGATKGARDAGACEDTYLRVSVSGLDRDALLGTVRDTQAKGATPIAASLEAAVDDFPAEGRNVIVLITDGLESCRLDLREVVEDVRARGIDLRIIGFDLDERARATFEGLGTFENAASAAELLAALTRAVEVAPAVATYPVKVTLIRDGEPAVEGASVTFVGAIDEENYGFTTSGDGEHTTSLPAGAFTARVSDAFTDQPLTFSGLVVAAPGGEFTFDLTPAVEVTLSLSDTRPPAGSLVTVAYEGAPGGEAYVGLRPAGAEGIVLGWAWVSGDSGSVELMVPDESGAYEAVYVLSDRVSGDVVIGQEPFEVQPVTASLKAPPTVGQGSRFEVEWTGPDNNDDFVTVVPVGAAEGTWLTYAYTSSGNPVQLEAPDVPGDYELRYATGATSRTLASLPITVEAAEASLSAPASVGQGAEFEVGWTGPDNRDDYIAIVPAGAAEGTWLHYDYTANGNPVRIKAPDAPGDYELRYITGATGRTLASLPITVEAVGASLSAPATVAQGADFQVAWTGPDNRDDFITVVPVGAEEGTWLTYAYTSDGNPVTITAPVPIGDYELRYATGDDYLTLATLPIAVVAAEVSLTAPSSVSAGETFEVSWSGPGGERDYITIVTAGAPDGTWEEYVYVTDGNPVYLTAPSEPGAYELRYMLGGSDRMILSLPITVR